jgi:hypothetical protein
MGTTKQSMLEECESSVDPNCPHGQAGTCESLCACGHSCSDHGPECGGANDCECPEFSQLPVESDDDGEDDGLVSYDDDDDVAGG